MAVGEPVEWHIEVGPGVGAHGHQSDLERDPGPVDGFGGFTGEVISNDRRWEPWIGHEPVGDHMAEINELRHGMMLPTVRRTTRWTRARASVKNAACPDISGSPRPSHCVPQHREVKPTHIDITQEQRRPNRSAHSGHTLCSRVLEVSARAG